MTILTYFLLLSALIVHLIFDYHKEKTNSIRHWLSATIAVSVSGIAGVLISLIVHNHWWQGMFYSLCIHLALFDPIWNIINQHPWYYSGDDTNPHQALTDKIWSRVPPMAQPLFRIWFIMLGVGVFYHLNLIIG